MIKPTEPLMLGEQFLVKVKVVDQNKDPVTGATVKAVTTFDSKKLMDDGKSGGRGFDPRPRHYASSFFGSSFQSNTDATRATTAHIR